MNIPSFFFLSIRSGFFCAEKAVRLLRHTRGSQLFKPGCPIQNFLAYAVGIDMPYSKFLSLRRRQQYTLFCIFLLQAVVFFGWGSYFGAEDRIILAIVVFFHHACVRFFQLFAHLIKTFPARVFAFCTGCLYVCALCLPVDSLSK